MNNTLPTVQAQVKYICEAFLSHQVRQYDLRGKRYLELLRNDYQVSIGRGGTREVDFICD